jgi:basic membrane protein A
MLALVIALGGSSAHAAKRYRVAVVTDVGGVVSDIVQRNLAGLRRARRDFDIEATLVTQPARTSFTSTFKSLARQRYDLVYGLFGPTAAGVVAAAKAYPDTLFAVGDVRIGERLGAWPPNVQGVAARDEEIGFVVGYLAGLMERRRPGPDTVGSVGGWTIPSVDRFIAGFRAGARHASSRIRLLNAYSYNFGDPEPCERIAEGQIAKGAGVVFNVAGGCGRGALEAARKHDVWGIGVDVDQSALGRHVLTSAVKDVGLMLYKTIEQVVQGRFEGGRDALYGLREGGLRLGRVSPGVPRAVITQTRRIERDIASGRIKGIPTALGS